MKYGLTFTYIHELGMRANQEDSIFPEPGKATGADRLFLVCDGMGGHEKGEVASRVVCDAIADYVRTHVDDDTIFTEEMFNEALDKAYAQLDASDDGKSGKRMGTTLTMALFHKGGCFMAHMGDSRIYHVRPSEKRILYMSKDHSLVFDLFRSGEISFDEMKTHPKKNIITRAMMPGNENRLQADVVNTTDIREGDYFYLCSDGMTEQMDEADIVGILSSDNSDYTKHQRMLSATFDNMDNHSAFIIRVEKVEQDRETNDAYRNDEQLSRSNVANYTDLNKETPTKVKSANFVAYDPYDENRKKFPWVKVMLFLIAISAFGLFYFVPTFKDLINSQVTVEKSTIKNTDNYFDPDETVYGQQRRDSILNARKARAEKGDIIATGGDDEDETPKKAPEKRKDQERPKAKKTERENESKPAAAESDTHHAETANQGGGEAAALSAQPNAEAAPAAPAMAQPDKPVLDADFE